MDLQASGELAISQDSSNEKVVWDMLFRLLEHRMSRGEFTVIDATCSKTKDIQRYKELADSYRYRMICVDFTDVPLDVCLRQNKQRVKYKWVPNSAIENIYARFATQQIPSGVQVIKPDEFDTILEKPIDLSEYKKIVFIGDIHGCYDTLMQYPDFKNGLDPDVEYIFCGDYIDRGNQNAETMKFLQSIMYKPNVCFLEGNHERWLYCYGNDLEAKSMEFEKKTKLALIAGGYTQKMARMFYRKLRQMSHFTYNGFEVLACHGGIPNQQLNNLFVPTYKFIHGAGDYKDYVLVAEAWMGQTTGNKFLVFGHRNTESDPIQMADRVFNLEGKVEFGGTIRIVELTTKQYPAYGTTEDGGLIPYGFNVAACWNPIELQDCQPVDENLITEERSVETVEDAINYLRNNKFVQEKDLGNGVSSFNFTREAFYSKNWNRQTVLARGLFIDTENKKIIARSYEKFFKINEVHETELGSLRERFKFPVSAYVKENGYLAIVSYDYRNDDLFVASKSTTGGDYAKWIKEQLIEQYNYEALKYYLKTMYESGMPESVVFERIDPVNDPHIIEESEAKLVMLDIICNKLAFEKLSYTSVVELAGLIGCPVKRKAAVFNDWESFREFYYEITAEGYQYAGNYTEGFVFEDASGFMTKCKTEYYNFWKAMRGVADSTLRCGYIRSTGMLQSSTANLFYGFLKDCFKNDRNADTKSYPYKTDIVSLRNKFIQGGINND